MDEGEADSGIEMAAGGGIEANPSKNVVLATDEHASEDGDGKRKEGAGGGGTGASEGADEKLGDDAASQNPSDDTGDGSTGPTPSGNGVVEEDSGAVFIRVFIHDQNLQRCYKFHLDEVVFNAKKKVGIYGLKDEGWRLLAVVCISYINTYPYLYAPRFCQRSSKI